VKIGLSVAGKCKRNMSRTLRLLYKYMDYWRWRWGSDLAVGCERLYGFPFAICKECRDRITPDLVNPERYIAIYRKRDLFNT
jgi:hypothetical protein